ncbi:phosphatidylserine decarboxylase-domain-containing protein [Fomes fomentarius]|nr:phosphatidylserine decarboxylase-domain-containing protein [Fomes fomentarius]
MADITDASGTHQVASTQSRVKLITRKLPADNIVQKLRTYLAENADFKNDFQKSFDAALESGVREFDDFGIKTFDEYINWYETLLGWIPEEDKDGKFIYHTLCLFYYVMNFNPVEQNWTSLILPSTQSPYKWLSQWVIDYAKEMGKFLDTPESITPDSLATFYNAPSYHMEDYPTFNEFFARNIDPAKRPIDAPDSNKIIVSPADASFDSKWAVDEDAECMIKGIPWPISRLLDDPENNYGSQFAGGWFCHSFLGPNDYHRQHAPVSGTVLEARVIEGLCYLEVEAEQGSDQRWHLKPHRPMFHTSFRRMPLIVGRDAPAPDERDLNAPNSTGYQFIQARALILIKTEDIGLVAVLPIGMAQVSSVVLSVKAGDEVKKGDELSCFQFGGSDIVMVFEKEANVEFTATSGTHYNFGKQVAVAQAI